MQHFNKSKSIVAFIDILGFKEIVKANDKSENNEIFYQLRNALQQSFNKAILLTKYWLVALDEAEKENFTSKLQIRQFSDNLYFSYDYSEDKYDYDLGVYLVTIMAAYYQRIMLSKNFYVRGGIADGQNYFDEQMIFSSALIKAYEFETKTAKYPRIIIDKEILDSLDPENFVKEVSSKMFIEDWTGLIFLDPFKIIDSMMDMYTNYPEIGPALEKLVIENPALLNANSTLNLEPDISDNDLTVLVRRNLQQNLAKHKNQPDLYEKYLWLREFVNWLDNYESNLIFKYYWRGNITVEF